jgi:hypothetical protein
MATFGQGVNPALGRVDYTPYLQGAQFGAQASMQGLQQLGESIAGGIEKHFKQQEQLKVMLGELESIRNNNPTAFSGIDPKIAERVAKGDIKYKEIAPLYAQVMTNQKLEQFALKKEQDRVQASLLERQTAADEARAAATVASAGAEFNRSKMPKTEKPMQEMTMEQVDALKKAGQDVQWVPSGRPGTVMVTGGSPFGPTPVTNVNMGGNEYDKVLGTKAAERHFSEYDAAKNAPANIAKIDEVIEILRSGDVTTGIGAEIFQNANRLRAKFLNDQKAGKSVTNTQILDSLLGADVFPMIGALGVGARGMDTPAEREFIRQSFTGTKEFTPEALLALAEFRRNKEIDAVGVFDKNNEAGTYKRFFEVTGIPVPDFSDIPPKGIPSAEWMAMTPEDRALWGKKKK